jgi:hypothetical protein
MFDDFALIFYFCNLYFNPLNTFMRKGKDPDPDLDIVTNGAGCGSGRPKNIWILWIWIRNNGPKYKILGQVRSAVIDNTRKETT